MTINAQRTVLTDYAPDPVGTRLFRALSNDGQAGMDGRRGLITPGDKGRPEQTFNGYAARRQAFSGEAALAMYGTAKPIVPTGMNTFDNTPATSDVLGEDLTLRIFAARARRRR